MKAGIALLVVALAAGCGGANIEPTTAPRQARELARLRADIRRLKIVAAPVPHSLMGTPKLLAATGAFLDHEQASSLDNLTKNRLIDLAASAVAGSCDQCFQQLEAARPIPAIAHP